MGHKLKSLAENHLKRVVGGWGRLLLDQLLPPRCLSCGAGVQDAGRICADCWKGLNFLQGPACAWCGYPFEFGREFNQEFDQKFDQPGAVDGQCLCMACVARRPPFDVARAALRYDDGSRRMILSFKHGDRTDYTDFFGQLLQQAAAATPAPDLLADPLVIPVPLHKKRLGKRRYNQAALMARALARRKKMDYVADMLARTKHTPPQEGNYRRRKRNIAGAFAFNRRYGERARGRNIILVDDVYTTGATAGACARILKRNGVGHVTVLTLARVCRPGDRA